MLRHVITLSPIELLHTLASRGAPLDDVVHSVVGHQSDLAAACVVDRVFKEQLGLPTLRVGLGVDRILHRNGRKAARIPILGLLTPVLVHEAQLLFGWRSAMGAVGSSARQAVISALLMQLPSLSRARSLGGGVLWC